MVTKDMCLPAHGTMVVDISTAWLRAVLAYNVGCYIVQNVVVYNCLLFLSFKTFGHKAFVKFEKTLKTPKSWSKDLCHASHFQPFVPKRGETRCRVFDFNLSHGLGPRRLGTALDFSSL